MRLALLGMGTICLVVGMSCCRDAPADVHASNPANVQLPSAPVGPTHADSVARMTVLSARRDSLAQAFEFKRQNLPIASYYHKTWWASYYIRRVALLAGVDSNGVVFIIHNYNCSIRPSYWSDIQKTPPSRQITCEGRNADLYLEIGDSSFILPSDPGMEARVWGKDAAIARDMILSTGQFCSDYFAVEADSKLLAALAAGDVTRIGYARTCAGRRLRRLQTIGKRDRAAIQDCARLGQVLQELRQYGG